MGREWYVTHIYAGENYLERGPYDEDGIPATCLQMMWEGQANYLREYLNKLEGVAESYKISCMNWAKESHQKGNRENKEFWEKKAKSIAELLDQSYKKGDPSGQ